MTNIDIQKQTLAKYAFLVTIALAVAEKYDNETSVNALAHESIADQASLTAIRNAFTEATDGIDKFTTRLNNGHYCLLHAADVKYHVNDLITKVSDYVYRHSSNIDYEKNISLLEAYKVNGSYEAVSTGIVNCDLLDAIRTFYYVIYGENGYTNIYLSAANTRTAILATTTVEAAVGIGGTLLSAAANSNAMTTATDAMYSSASMFGGFARSMFNYAASYNNPTVVDTAVEHSRETVATTANIVASTPRVNTTSSPTPRVNAGVPRAGVLSPLNTPKPVFGTNQTRR